MRIAAFVRDTITEETSMRTMLFILLAAAGLSAAPALAQQQPRIPPMLVTSDSFPDGGMIPVEYTQAGPDAGEGRGTSPQLSWSNVPEGTESFVLLFRDPEVVRNRSSQDQVHWLVWNIPPTTTSLPEGVAEGSPLPDGSHQISATGAVYRGPGAPASDPHHHYTFELYALDTMLEIEPTEDAQEARTRVMDAMQGHILARGLYVGLFRRPE